MNKKRILQLRASDMHLDIMLSEVRQTPRDILDMWILESIVQSKCGNKCCQSGEILANGHQLPIE